jgi:hypothetical protein
MPRTSTSRARPASLLAIRAPLDPVLHAVAPLGLASAAGTALVVDLDPGSPGYGGNRTLASLVADGPRLDDLVPRRAGVAVLANGGVDPEEALAIVEALSRRWPAVVARVGATAPVPTLEAFALLPGVLAPEVGSPAVYQATRPGPRPRLPGVVLPAVGRSSIEAMLAGRRPPRRWVAAWRPAWSFPWV